MTLARLALLPRDGLFLKDGRGWYTSDIGRSHSLAWPEPPTIRGALRAAAGRALIASGRTLQRTDWDAAPQDLALQRMVTFRRPVGDGITPTDRLWPAPADTVLLAGASHFVRLDPRPPPSGGHPTLGAAHEPAALERLWRPGSLPGGKPLPRPAFWTESDFAAWLRADAVRPPEPAAMADLAPPRRPEVHVTIDPLTGAAADTLLFSGEIVESLTRDHHEWGLAVECELPPGVAALPAGPLPLAGRRRLTHTLPAPADLFAAPRDLGADAPGLRLVLVTPAEFERGWLPDGFDESPDPERGPYLGRIPGLDAELALRAAIVPRPQHLSGWDMARRRPRPTRRLVPAGAVYFFQRADAKPFTAEDRRALWLRAWGRGTTDGLGLVVAGRWDIQAKDRT